MWFIGVEVEEETSAPYPKKNPGSAPECPIYMLESTRIITVSARNVFLSHPRAAESCHGGVCESAAEKHATPKTSAYL